MTKTRGQRAFEKMMKRKRAKRERTSMTIEAPQDEAYSDAGLDLLALEILDALPEEMTPETQAFAAEVEALRAAAIALDAAITRAAEEADRIDPIQGATNESAEDLDTNHAEQ
jgi:hypothetical protein